MEPEQFFSNFDNNDIINFSKDVVNNTLNSKCTFIHGNGTNGKSTLMQLLIALSGQNKYISSVLQSYMIVEKEIVNRLSKCDFIFIENIPDNDNFIRGICNYANKIKGKFIFITNRDISYNMAPGSVSVIKMNNLLHIDNNLSVFKLLGPETLSSYHEFLSK